MKNENASIFLKKTIEELNTEYSQSCDIYNSSQEPTKNPSRSPFKRKELHNSTSCNLKDMNGMKYKSRCAKAIHLSILEFPDLTNQAIQSYRSARETFAYVKYLKNEKNNFELLKSIKDLQVQVKSIVLRLNTFYTNLNEEIEKSHTIRREIIHLLSADSS